LYSTSLSPGLDSNKEIIVLVGYSIVHPLELAKVPASVPLFTIN